MDLKTLYYCINSFPGAIYSFLLLDMFYKPRRGLHDSRHGLYKPSRGL